MYRDRPAMKLISLNFRAPPLHGYFQGPGRGLAMYPYGHMFL